ncbi:hypothetical protein [Bremerella sp.]|uniref:hypothetical protein n=1 Tax=Bremerella sp. TaxID=2795602 RepID=UPI00391DE951
MDIVRIAYSVVLIVFMVGCSQAPSESEQSTGLQDEPLTAQSVLEDPAYSLAYTSENSGISYYIRDDEKLPFGGGFPREGEGTIVAGQTSLTYVAIKDGEIVVSIANSDKSGLIETLMEKAKVGQASQ